MSLLKMEDRKMNFKTVYKKIMIRKIYNNSLISILFFLMISYVLYSFVIIKENHPVPGYFSPDKKDSIAVNQPKIDIKVNKKYDESGNLIQYDSSYSIIYSSPNSDIQYFNFDNDSLFMKFKNNMNINDFFNNDFFTDDFFNQFHSFGFNNDLFQMNPMIGLKQMEEMMNKMKKLQQSDSTIIQPQQNSMPKKNITPPKMITL
jgi:hypothetical protein